jgi:uncharacterized membrane protein
MTFTETMELAVRVLEASAAVVLLLGLFVCVGLAVRSLTRWKDGRRAFRVLRESFGGVILLGLEILVAADLIRTVTVAPTLENVAVLGIIVLIRTVLSFSIEVEIEGVLPWRRAMSSGAANIARAAERDAQPAAPRIEG